MGLLIFVLARPTVAQPPFEFPFPRSIDEMMDGFFRLTPEQRAELRSVEVPVKAERDYGEQIFQAYRNQLTAQGIQLSSQSPDARYMSQLVDRLKPAMTHQRRYPKIDVYVVDSGEVDARSAPGGFLVFYRGLLEFAESEAALIGIVGHELSHLDRRHQLKPLQQQLMARKKFQPNAAAAGFNLKDFFDFGSMSLNSYHPFHPEEEAEADRDAVQWLHQLGYQPLELARLFQRLSDLKQNTAFEMPGFMRTHPAMKERSSDVTRLAAELQQRMPKADLVVGQEALVQRVPARLDQDDTKVKRNRQRKR